MVVLLNVILLINSQLIGGEFRYTVQPNDSLLSIGARFGVAARVIREANSITGTRLQPGRILTIDNRHIIPDRDDAEILINVPQRLLFYFKQAILAASYPAAAGKRGWITPTGRFEITSVDEDPT